MQRFSTMQRPIVRSEVLQSARPLEESPQKLTKPRKRRKRMQQLAVHRAALTEGSKVDSSSFQADVLQQLQHISTHLRALDAHIMMQSAWHYWGADSTDIVLNELLPASPSGTAPKVHWNQDAPDFSPPCVAANDVHSQLQDKFSWSRQCP